MKDQIARRDIELLKDKIYGNRSLFQMPEKGIEERLEDVEKENSELKDRLQMVIDCLGLKEEEYIGKDKTSPLGYYADAKSIIKTRFIKPKK